MSNAATAKATQSVTIPDLLAEIRNILADIRENGGSLTAATPADGVPAVRVVTAPDPENEHLQELVFELAGLLEEWRRQPVFNVLSEYGAWMSGLGPRVDAALDKVVAPTHGPLGVRIPEPKKPRRKKSDDQHTDQEENAD